MKEEILRLRQEGKTYTQIQDILGCSKGTIAYHCGEGQKEKTFIRQKKFRSSNTLLTKVNTYKSRKSLVENIRKFQKRDNLSVNKNNKKLKKTFTYLEVLDKIGKKPTCYLTGIPIDLNINNYQLDHIVPVSKGGDNSLNNLGLLLSEINQMKSDMTIKELLNNCILILEHNGYKVVKAC